MSVGSHLDQIGVTALPASIAGCEECLKRRSLACGGARTRTPPGMGPVDQETYSHEVVSFGFWMGDENVPAPSYYSYTVPEPVDLRRQPLQPDTASWSEQPGGSLALLPYEAVRTAVDPRKALLAFLESAYRAGARLLGWDQIALTSSWCPGPPQLDAMLAGVEPAEIPEGEEA